MGPAGSLGPGELRAELWHQQAQNLASRRVPVASTPTIEKAPTTMPRRLVQVLIADTNENVPLDAALLYRGEPIFTDLADNELFFELDIKGMLAEHNAKRVTFADKKSKDSPTFLEPARVRDLKMNVVTIASF
jgi:hypothetical protein